jgi:transcriptional regulator with XRE-family HTH domain
MNFGDRLKQLRIQKNLTQPQLAQAIGIEQSYLSKLENDRSVPGADIFQAIMRALQMDVAAFLEGVDENVVHRELRQVPDVASHLSAQSALRIRGVKAWLYGSAVAGVLGLTLFLTGREQLLLSNQLYSYSSPGVQHPDEPSDVFFNSDYWLRTRVNAGELEEAELPKRRLELMSRTQVDFRALRENRGDTFSEKVPGGTRVYVLKGVSSSERAGNRALMIAGLLLTFGSLFGFFVEWRLRPLRRG